MTKKNRKYLSKNNNNNAFYDKYTEKSMLRGASETCSPMFPINNVPPNSHSTQKFVFEKASAICHTFAYTELSFNSLRCCRYLLQMVADDFICNTPF